MVDIVTNTSFTRLFMHLIAQSVSNVSEMLEHNGKEG